MTIAKYATNQPELEALAQAQYKRNLISSDIIAASKNYTSSTPFGQAVLKRQATNEAGEVISSIDLLSSLIAERLTKDLARRGPKPAATLIADAAAQILKATEVVPRYTGTTTNPLDLISVIALKSYIDAVGGGGGSRQQWPLASAVFLRIGEAIDLQRLDALCAYLDPEAYHKEQRRWTRDLQGIGNKQTNIVLGQRDLLTAAHQDRHEVAWTGSDRASVGAWINDIVLQHLQLVELGTGVPTRPNVSPPKILRPTQELVALYPEFIERVTEGRLVGYPMIEAPLAWVWAPGPGKDNHSGGNHTKSARKVSPLVRGRKTVNTSEPSPLAIALVNTLGATAFKADVDICKAFEWAAMHPSMEVEGLANMPVVTVQSLLRERAEDKAEYHETGIHPNGLTPGTEAHAEWRHTQRDKYEAAFAAERKFQRTRDALLASKTIRERERIFFGWNLDYRGRCYPIQTLLSPQGTTVEKALLRFAEGQHLTPAGEDEVMSAIAVATVGNKLSLADRIAWGRSNIKELLDATAGGDPEDIHLLSSQFHADEPWDALQLLRAAERTFRRGQPWDVPVGIDASQSGVQLLGGLLRDEPTLVATNVLRAPRQIGPDNGPVDGYVSVLEAAKHLLDAKLPALLAVATPRAAEKILNMSPEVRFQIERLLAHPAARKAAKITAMPRIYGSKYGTTLVNLREWVKAQGIDLAAEMGGWQGEGKVINTFTSLMRTAVNLTFPLAMQALAWLEKLAGLSLKQQEDAGVASPELRWELHDGTVVSYRKPEQNTNLVKKVTI